MICVDILMASYNGEKYIESQICSIIGQKYKNWRLLIHDDGSSDSTLEIVRYYSKIDARIELIDDGILCGGAAKNFLHLLKYSNSKYVMFADQDDIWFDNKISSMMANIEKCDSAIPTVVYSQAYIWYPEKGIMGEIRNIPIVKLKDFLFTDCGIIGCCSLFNSEAKKLLLSWEHDCSMHDYILQLICLSLGKIIYIPNSYMLYRQHSGSVTPSIMPRKWFTFKQVFSISPILRKSTFDDICYFFCRYKSHLHKNDLLVFNAFLDIPRVNVLFKLFLILKYRFSLSGSILRLVVKVFVRPFIK